MKLITLLFVGIFSSSLFARPDFSLACGRRGSYGGGGIFDAFDDVIPPYSLGGGWSFTPQIIGTYGGSFCFTFRIEPSDGETQEDDNLYIENYIEPELKIIRRDLERISDSDLSDIEKETQAKELLENYSGPIQFKFEKVKNKAKVEKVRSHKR